MNKQEFLEKLKNALAGLGEEEIKKSTDFYAEMIDDAVENGESEEEVIARLGLVEEIAQKIINETPLSKIVKENVKSRKWSASSIALLIICSPIWLPIAVGIFAAAVSLYLSLWAVIAALFAVFAGLLLGGLMLIVAAAVTVVSDLAKAGLMLGTGLIFIGVSVFDFYFAVILAKAFIRLTMLGVRKIKGMFMRKGGIK